MGQRYVVGCHQESDRAWVIVGYTNRSDGQPFKSMIEKRPGWGNPHIVDREHKHEKVAL